MQGGFGGVRRDEGERREEGLPGTGRKTQRSASPQDALPSQHRAG